MYVFLGQSFWIQILNVFFFQRNSIEECQTAEEFLLEPWVLMQLPFQPTLLHQWAVALLAEALKLRNQITDFFVIAYPQKLARAVEKLAKISSDLMSGANSFLSYYFKFCNNAALNIQAIILLFWDDFLEVFPTVYAALTFALSEECTNVVLELKQMAWSTNDNEEWVDSLSSSSCDFGLLSSAYNLFYWKSEHSPSFLFTNEMANTTEDTPSSLLQKFEQANSNAHVANPVLEALKTFVEKEIIEAGCLQGEEKEQILNVFNQNAARFMVFFRHYKAFFGKILILNGTIIVWQYLSLIYTVLKVKGVLKITCRLLYYPLNYLLLCMALFISAFFCEGQSGNFHTDT